MAVDDLWYLAKRAPDGARVPSKRHGRGKRWRVRFTDPDGRPKQRLFERKPDAERYDAAVRTDVSRGTYIDPGAGKVTLRAHAGSWLDGQTFDEATRQTVQSRLDTQILPVLGDREVRAIKPSTVQAFIRGMQSEGHSPRYVQVTSSTLSTVLGAAADDGLIAKNPCRAASVRLPKADPHKVVPWTIDRVFGVASALPDPYEATVYAGYGLGLRQGEILGFGPDDVDWLGRVVHVQRQIRIVRNTLVFAPPKGGKSRDVPLSSETALRLAAHMRAHPPVTVTLPWKVPEGKPTTARLFFTRNGSGIHRAWLNVVVWTPALRLAGVPTGRENGYHVLRHSFASALLCNGVDIRALAEYLGHTDPGFTLRTYTHLLPSAEDKTRAAIDRAFHPAVTVNEAAG